jgi:hypothetical protein
MTEAGIGRVLVASLHQAISDLLPTRLEFYESWLNPDGLRLGTIGLAPVQAVLSFLRQEGAAYGQVTRCAGEYAAEWTVASQWPAGRALIRSMPLWLRSRAVLRIARRTIRSTYGSSRAALRLRKGRGHLDVTESVFCNVRDTSSEHLCGFYEAVVSRLLALYDVPGVVRLDQCRAVGDPSCRLDVSVASRREPTVRSLASLL